MATAGCLTVKHVEANGYESVIQATNVAFIPKELSHPDATDPRAEVIAYGVPVAPGMQAGFEDGVRRYSNGMIYVMNEAGATVSKYDLDWLNSAEKAKAEATLISGGPGRRKG